MNEQQKQWYEEEARAIEEAKARLAYDYDLERNERFDIAWNIAWQHGHACGVYEVENCFRDLVPLLRPQMIYELIAVNTESYTDIRYRDYTTSKRKADLFAKIPKIHFTDSGHGIVFMVNELVGKKEKKIHGLRDYIDQQMAGE